MLARDLWTISTILKKLLSTTRHSLNMQVIHLSFVPCQQFFTHSCIPSELSLSLRREPIFLSIGRIGTIFPMHPRWPLGVYQCNYFNTYHYVCLLESFPFPLEACLLLFQSLLDITVDQPVRAERRLPMCVELFASIILGSSRGPSHLTDDCRLILADVDGLKLVVVGFVLPNCSQATCAADTSFYFVCSVVPVVFLPRFCRRPVQARAHSCPRSGRTRPSGKEKHRYTYVLFSLSMWQAPERTLQMRRP